MRTSTYHTRQVRKGMLNIVAGFALGGFVVGAMGMALMTEMAVYVAHGNNLHIGADILFASFSSVQLIVAACVAGAFAVACAAAALVVAVLAEA